MGETTLKINLQNAEFKVKFTVMNCHKYDGILGVSFLQEHQAVIDTREQSLNLKHNKTTLSFRLVVIKKQRDLTQYIWLKQ